jgi:hypothetical protein
VLSLGTTDSACGGRERGHHKNIANCLLCCPDFYKICLLEHNCRICALLSLDTMDRVLIEAPHFEQPWCIPHACTDFSFSPVEKKKKVGMLQHNQQEIHINVSVFCCLPPGCTSSCHDDNWCLPHASTLVICCLPPGCAFSWYH